MGRKSALDAAISLPTDASFSYNWFGVRNASSRAPVNAMSYSFPSISSTRFSTLSISFRNDSASASDSSRPGPGPYSRMSFTRSRSVERSCSNPRRLHSDSSISATVSFNASRMRSASVTCAAISASLPSLFGSRRTSTFCRTVSPFHTIATV